MPACLGSADACLSGSVAVSENSFNLPRIAFRMQHSLLSLSAPPLTLPPPPCVCVCVSGEGRFVLHGSLPRCAFPWLARLLPFRLICCGQSKSKSRLKQLGSQSRVRLCFFSGTHVKNWTCPARYAICRMPHATCHMRQRAVHTGIGIGGHSCVCHTIVEGT